MSRIDDRSDGVDDDEAEDADVEVVAKDIEENEFWTPSVLGLSFCLRIFPRPPLPVRIIYVRSESHQRLTGLNVSHSQPPGC